MNSIRREVLNGLFVLVISTLLSAAIAAFEIKFNLQVWVLIVMAVAIAISGYVTFEVALGHMAATAESTRLREEEWLKRVGTPARLELNREGEEIEIAVRSMVDVVKTMRPGSDLVRMLYAGPGGGREFARESRDLLYRSIVELLRQGKIREYKRIICFDHDVLANDPELKSGVLRVGEGPGTINRQIGDHCRLMTKTKGCSLYVAPAVVRSTVLLYAADKVSISLETFDQTVGAMRTSGTIFFSDPPNGEIIEQFRQMERATERRMVAVHKIVFPEDVTATPEVASR